MSNLKLFLVAAAGMLMVGLLPADTHAEHCAGANYVDGLEPSETETWVVGTERQISWLVGASCGLMTYQVEISRDGQPYEPVGTTEALFYEGRYNFPWEVTGPAGVQVRFRVHRVLTDRETPYAATAPIEIKLSVPTRTVSWSALRSRF